MKFPNVENKKLKLFLSNIDNNDDAKNNNNSKHLEEQIKKENFKEDLNKQINKDKNKNSEENTENIEKQKIKLTEFTENQIKALILYYFFYINLNKNIEISNQKIIDLECYLISEKWMNKFKGFYLYEYLTEIIEKIIGENKNNIDNNVEIDEIIYEQLLNDKYNDYLIQSKELQFRFLCQIHHMNMHMHLILKFL